MSGVLQAEGGLDLAEGADRSDKGQPEDGHMGIAGLSLPSTASMDGLHGHHQSHPFNSAGVVPASSLSVWISIVMPKSVGNADM